MTEVVDVLYLILKDVDREGKLKKRNCYPWRKLQSGFPIVIQMCVGIPCAKVEEGAKIT